VAVSDALRGQVASAPVMDLIKKVFYNLYNFYKLMPQIVNPYIFAFFLISVFRWIKDRIYNSSKVAVVFMTVVTFLVAAASIPFFRYIHPVVPLIYILGVDTLVWIMAQISSSKKFVICASTFLIIVFAVGQTLGVFFLDSRFEANVHNVGKPPIYVELSQILRNNTKPNYVVITNLDTWGSWYGERKTIWFPLEPEQIIDPTTGKIPFDAIYLTSYLIDDDNYYMGANWRKIFNNPTDVKKWICDGCLEIAKEFKLEKIFKVSASDVYEKQGASAVLLLKK
jgi:hypothetical protein